MKAPKKPRKRNYINNREMYDVLVVYLDDCNAAEARNEPLPVIPRYLGECFLLIAQKYATKPNFSGYQFIEEMKSDAVLNCVKYCRNFNPEYKNPFSYFTQFTHNAFLQRIMHEKRNLYTRYKSYQDLQILEQINGAEGINGKGGHTHRGRGQTGTAISSGPVELNDISNEFIRNFEQKLEEAKRKKPAKELANTVSKFFTASANTG